MTDLLGIVRKDGDPSHLQKAVYSLTERGIDLLPLIVAMSAWSQKYDAGTRRAEAAQLVQGGPKLLRRLDRQLRDDHGVS